MCYIFYTIKYIYCEGVRYYKKRILLFNYTFAMINCMYKKCSNFKTESLRFLVRGSAKSYAFFNF